MSADRSHRSGAKFLWLTVPILATLACRAATRLVIPDTPTPLPTATATPTSTPTALPTFTPTVVFEAACPAIIRGILNTVGEAVNLTGKKPEDGLKEDGGISLVTYDVTNDSLTDPHFERVPDELEDERDDRTSHTAIWDYFASIIPPAEREMVSEFSIFTDGKGKHLAAVSPTFRDPEEWMLQVDILDAENYYDLTYTLLHEQGHLLTLNAEQVPPSQAIFNSPGNENIVQKEAEACPQYFTGEGCSQPDSYINQFFTQFWPYIYPDWKPIDQEEDKDTRETLLEDFYQTYQDQFLTDYAPTSPMEDIAESWAFFVLSPKPELDSIANEKILFFFEYPELVGLRQELLVRLCANFPR